MVVAAAAQAATSPQPGKPAPSASAIAQGNLASGEVLEIDQKEKRVLLKHGPIKNIGMDAMTMEFRVPDGKLLASLRRGDRVRFAAVYKDGDYEVTRIEVVKPRKQPKPRAAP